MLTPSDQNLSEHVAAFHVSDDFIVNQAAAIHCGGTRRWRTSDRGGHTGALERDREGTRGERSRARRARVAGRVVLIEAEQLVETLTVAGRVDVDAFRATLQPLIKPGVKLRMHGELVSLLAARGDVDGALAIERLGHELAHTLELNVLCGYHVAGARPLRMSEIERIQAAHDRSVFEEPTRAGASAKPAADPHFHAVRFYQDAHSLARIVSTRLRAAAPLARSRNCASS